ncbi:VWA domain-containing protein [Paenibacillus sp. ATY16]|uniref:vWA domain-containing protein n=1 Tax=Paenibacillus sp. ATY16 TaxID=1759312 RepID=UPI00200F0003|nr:VWA domain-containing protein [Paenibacillus sp. ATY16]MCK9858321.1 VWA domain-containing protein [Paenibacillus sp. ATY16]
MTEAVTIAHRWNREYYPCGGAEKTYLLLELKGAAAIQCERAPINVGLILDRSGSMSGQPLAYSLKACQYVTDQMAEGDLLSMVAFDDEVETVFSPEKVIYKDGMKSKIAAIEPGGSTNLSGGLILGAQYVAEAKQEGMVNRVLLLSDGYANEGITDRGKLSRIAREYQSMGIGISALGVGHQFDEELMEGIADGGGGNFYYIEKPDDIPSIFAKELQGVLSVLGQNMRLKLQSTEAAELQNVYGYKPVDQKNGNMYNLGDIYDQEVKSLLIEMTFFPQTEGIHPILQLELEYMDVTDSVKPCKVQLDISASFTKDLELLAMPMDTIVEKQMKITETALTIEKAMEAFDQGRNDAGITMLQAQADDLLRMAVLTDDADLRTESLLLYEQLESFGEAPMTSESRKALHSQKYRTMKRKS